MKCPCHSQLEYKDCCEPYHTKEKHPPTPLALMRSRYAAFATHNAAYLMNTTLPAKRKYHNEADLLEWGQINTWINLEIVDTAPNIVEFIAYFTENDGTAHVQRERSLFQKINDRWFYVSETK